MFYGQFENKIDEKNRLMIPRKMREDIGVKLFIMKGYEGSLSVYKEEDFKVFFQKQQELSYTNRASRDFIRATIGSANEVEIDKLGRIQIPTYFASKYNLGKEVIVLGAGDHFEIWNKDVFNDYENNLESNFENVAEGLFLNK